MPDDAVTLGEVHRLLVEIRTDMKELRRDVGDLRTAVGIQRDRGRRLEGIVYGAGGVASAGFITALWAVITGR